MAINFTDTNDYALMLGHTLTLEQYYAVQNAQTCSNGSLDCAREYGYCLCD